MYTEVKFTTPLHLDLGAVASFFPELRLAPSGHALIDDIDPMRFLTVILKDVGDDGYSGLGTNLSAKDLAEIATRFPEPFRQSLRVALAGTALDLPHLDAEEMQHINDARILREDAYAVSEALLADAALVPQSPRAGTFSAETALGVLQGEAGFTSSADPRPILGSFGASSCIIVALHNPATKRTALAHVDPLVDIASLSSLANWTSSQDATPTAVHLAGGDDTSRETVVALLVWIAETPGVSLASARLFDDFDPMDRGIALAIDAKDGTVSTQFYPTQLHIPGLAARMAALSQNRVVRPLRQLPRDFTVSGIEGDGPTALVSLSLDGEPYRQIRAGSLNKLALRDERFSAASIEVGQHLQAGELDALPY